MSALISSDNPVLLSLLTQYKMLEIAMTRYVNINTSWMYDAAESVNAKKSAIIALIE